MCCSVLSCVAVSRDSSFHADQRKKVRVPKQKENLRVLQSVAVCCSTANPTWGDISECCFKAQSSKLERLFSLKRGKRDVRALSFELSKMSPQVGLAVYYSAL